MSLKSSLNTRAGPGTLNSLNTGAAPVSLNLCSLNTGVGPVSLNALLILEWD